MFVSSNNRLPNIDSENKTERSLAIWVRHTSKIKDLDEEFAGKLNTILSDKDLYRIDKRDIRWENNYTETTRFVYKFKRIPSAKSKDSTERKPGSWVRRQRDVYRQNTISDIVKIRKLKEIGIIVDNETQH